MQFNVFPFAAKAFQVIFIIPQKGHSNMETIFLEPTEDSPKLLLDPKLGKILVKGRSFMEDTVPYYSAILEWLRDYFKEPQQETVIELEFEYINSASERMVIDVLAEFNKYFILGHKVKVIWSYPPEDESLIEMGEELSEMFDIPIERRALA